MVAAAQRELVFVNGNVADYEQLIADLQGNDESRIIEVVVLDSDQNGIEQVSQILSDRSGLSAVHFITHGADGQISLGSSWLTNANLPQHSEAIAKWGEALTQSGDILFYGCNIAADKAGQGLLDGIAKLTGADVAASTDLTGYALFGGDWQLEFQTGSIEASVVADAQTQTEWHGLMAITTNSTSTSSTTTATNSLTWSHTVNSGSDRVLFVGLSIDNGVTATGVTYGGQAMTLVGRSISAGSGTAELWQLISPTVGTANVVATISSSVKVVGGAVTFNGVDQTTPTNGSFPGASATSSTPSNTIDSAPGDMVIGVLWANDSVTATEGGGQTTQWNFSTGGASSPTGVGSTEPGAASVTISYTLSASAQWVVGGTSIKPAAANPAPTISNLAGDNKSYLTGSGAVVIEQGGNVNITDIDSPDFDTGTLTVSIAAGSDPAEDVLAIRNQGTAAGQIGISGANVTYGGVTIGTFAGGSGGTNLVITLNANANATNTAALLQNITYQNTDGSSPTGGARTVRFVLTDGDGGTSANYDTTVNVPGASNTLVVTSTSDVSDGTVTSIAALNANKGADGVISLREAITATNNTAGTDFIQFNISGAGPHTINVGTALPTITGAVIIDGWSEPDYVTNGNKPIVILDGNGLAADGLVLSSTADGSTIRGLVIRDFGTTTAHDGIEIQAGSDNNTIAGNYIGRLTTTGADAGAGEVTTGQGLNILGANNTIDGNVISGNWAGVLFSGSGASGNLVVRNLIGTDATGTVLIGNSSNGVDIGNGAPNNTIGGVGAGNFIVGSGNDGVTIWGAGATGNKVQGNTIGTDATGTLDWGNSGYGVIVTGSAVGNLVGGANAGEGNVIAFNNSDGAAVDSAGTVSNAFLGNSIYSNTGLGIDLIGANGVNANDSNDPDTGPNNLQNFPVLGAVRVVSGTQLAVTGTLNSTASSYYRIEFFASTSADATGYGEGQRYLGFVNVSTDGSGNAAFNTTLTAALAAGETVSATATKSNATYSTFTDTSEFSQNTVAFEGMALWRTSGDSSPNLRIWDGTAFAPADNSSGIGSLSSLRAAEAPTRDEIIVIGRNTLSNIVGEIWNGTSWSALPSNPLGTYSPASPWMADVAYESVSGNAMMVWGTDTALKYSVWNATSWTAAANLSDYWTLSGGTVAYHVQLASKSGANEMVLAVTDNLGKDYAYVWNGTSWSTGTQVSTGSGSSSAVAYEAQSGRAMITYADAATPTLYYRIWNGSSWSAQSSFAMTGVGGGTYPAYINLASDPNSNRIAVAVTPSGLAGSVQYFLNTWDGSAWATGLVATSSGVDQLMPGIDVAFESSSGEAIAAYGVTGSNVVRYRTWTAAGGWSAENNGPTVGAAPRVVALDSDPYSDRIMLSEQDGANDLYAAQWSGAAWGSPTTIELNTGETNYQPFAFVWDQSAGPAIDLDANNSSGATGSDFTTRFSGAGAVAVADSDATVSDPLSANLVSLTVTLTNRPDGANEVLAANTSGTSITASYSSATGILALTGSDTLANYQQVLRTVTYNNTAGSPNTTDRIITFVANDGTRASGTSTTTVKLANLPPVNTVPGTQQANSVGTVVFSVANGNAISVSDPDAGASTVQVTLTATQGTLTLSGIAGLSFTTGDGTADATMTFTGSLANINAALNGMTFNGDPFRSSGTGSVQIVSNDLGNTGFGGAQSDTDTVTVNMVPLGTPYMITGMYTGNGTTLNVTGLGFQPDVVIIKETSNNKVAVIKTSTMAGAASKEMVGGTATSTGSITSLNADGFTVVNTDNIANVSGQTFTYIAFKASSGVMQVGSYSGTGVAGNAVTGLGFSPELVFVMDASNQAAVFRSSADTNSYDFTKNAYPAAVTSLDANGFTLGNAAQANKAGDTYYYVAWNAIPGLMNVGGYTGDGTDNRNITGVGFAPEWLMVQSSSDADPAVHHTEAQGASTDVTNYFTGTTSTNPGNRIQQLQADGFQVGADADVNAAATAFSYAAWRQETGPTISAISNQTTPEDTPLGPIAFTIGDAETAAGSLSVTAGSSNPSLLDVTNIVFGGSGANRTLTLTPAANASGSVAVTVYVSDGQAYSLTVFTLTVTAVNDAPVLDNSGTMTLTTITEDQTTNGGNTVAAIVASAGGDRITDPDAGAVEGMAITALTSGNGTWQYSINGGGSWSNVGAVSGNSALLLRATDLLRFVPDAQNADSANVTFRAWDQTSSSAGSKVDVSVNGGTTAFSTATETASITVTAVNDAPFMPGVAFDSISEDTNFTMLASTLAGYSSDPDTGAQKGVAVVGVDDSNGTWQYTLNGTNWFNIGSVSASNALLLAADAISAFRFVPNANWNGTTGLFQYKAWDRTSGTAGTYVDASVSGGTTAFSNTSGSALQVTPVNDAPTITNGATVGMGGSYSEDGPSSWFGVSGVINALGWSDADAGAVRGMIVIGSTGNGTWQYSTDTVSWSNVGAVTATNGLLLSDTSALRYVGDNANGETPTIQLRAWDMTTGSASTNAVPSYTNPGAGGGTTAFSTQSASAFTMIFSVNDAPVLDNTKSPALTAQNEDSGAPVGAVGTLVSSLVDFASPSGQVDNITDVDSGAFLGIAVTAADTTNGTWWYSINGGTNWNALGAMAANNARLLAADASTRLYFQPNANYNGTIANAITFRAWDQTSGTNGALADTTTNGGTTAFSTATDTASLTITAVNDPPVITSNGGGASASVSVAENTTAVTTVTSTDVDGGAAVYSILVGGDGVKFTVNPGTGTLSFLAAPDYENPTDIGGNNTYDLTVQVSDGNGGTDTQMIAVTVINVVDGIRITPTSVVPIGGETRVNTTTTDNQAINPNVAQAIATDANGNFVVVWVSNLQDGAFYGIYAQRYSADGTALGPEFQVNTTTADNQLNPAVAMDAAGNFVVTWASNLQDGSGYGVYAQRYNAAGIAQGSEFLVNTTTTNGQSGPAIAMTPTGAFVIAWTGSAQDPDGSSGIFAQRFNASGVAQGGEFRVNTYTTDTQQLTSVAMDAAGNFVVTWASNLQDDGASYGVYGQRFDASGAALGAEFRVNTTIVNSQLYHDVAMLADGRFVVAYQSRNADGSFEVYLQRYATDGSTLGGETRVNTTTVASGQQPVASVSADADGNITVVWNSTADGSGLGVVGRRFDWSGTPLTSEFQVNTTTSGNQLYPEVVWQPGGGFIVAWSGNGAGDADGVFLQRYGLTTTEGGGTATFQVVLESAPAANVTIPISVSDGTEGSVSVGSVTFNSGNWNVPQTVTITGLQDYINDGSQRYQVILGAATSGDANFHGLNPGDLWVTNLEIPNTTPVNTVPGAQVTAEDTPLVFMAGTNPISIADADAGATSVQVTLTATNGTLILNGTTGLTFSVGDGLADTTMTFTGTVANINSALNGLMFTPTSNYFGAASLQIVTSDIGNTGTGGTLTDTDNVAITVNPVADTPSVTNAITNEDTQSTSGLVISRNAADGAEVTHFKITGITNGTLYKNDGVTQITNGTFITFAEGNAGLKFTPTANFNGSGSFTVQASTSNGDAGLGGSTVNATITVNAVNDAPTATITPVSYAATEQVA